MLIFSGIWVEPGTPWGSGECLEELYSGSYTPVIDAEK